MNTKRIEWIDVCKGLGMVLVVLGHTGVSKFSQVTYDWIYSFHMPLFYMLSGLCFNTQKYNNFNVYIKRRWKTLLFPFFVLNTVIFVWGGVFPVPNLSVNFLDIITGVSAMYFIRVLFISELWCFLFRKLISDKLLFILSIIGISVAGTEIVNSYGNIVLLKYIFPSSATIFYAMGNILSDKLKSYNVTNKYNGLLIIILSVGFSLGLLYSLTNWDAIILAISGITTLVTCSLVFPLKYTKIRNLLSYIGKNTLVILAFHPLLYNGMKPITSLFIQSNAIDGVFRMIATWIILFILIYVFNKWLPWAVGKTNK